MKIFYILAFLLILAGCESTNEYSTGKEPVERAPVVRNQELDQLIEVTDMATGETAMRPMSDFFEIVRDVDEPPKVLKSGKVRLPKGFKGKIEAVVELVVSKEGVARDINIVSINSPEFNEYVLELASTTKFKPGKHQGVIVEVKIQIPLKIGV